MPEPSEREIELFKFVLEMPANERAAFLDEACVGDTVLRRRVKELLEAGEKAGAFLENPATRPQGPAGTTRLPVTAAEKPGDRIGHYKLLQQIGEGGCGIVYMAEQEQPVRRRVALKVIKLGMDTKEVIARFEAERQALALMDHPNIAKVLDAGATATGRPYFVMELVRGIKVTDYCDQNNLSTQERLELFILICRAIQHAHQKGIIHRDIKPSNILVTMNDGAPLPKVIDFGIAKATHGRLTDKTLFTAFEQFIGTPAYMSPEQAEMSALDIDTRSDIYSLGVLLYELLTGQTPFNANELLKSGLDEIRRTIREHEPASPSACLNTMQIAVLTAIARRRKAEPPKLIHLVRGDLDWIVMKALEKDRTRRYDTAKGLAMDVQRFLNSEPITARPQSKLYRFKKLVRRNKLAFAGAAVLGAVLGAGIAVSTWQAVRATRAEREQRVLRANESQLRSAEAEARKHAEAEAARARQAQTQSEQRLAEGLVAQGDALASVGHWDQARSRYREAEAGWQKLGLNTFPAQVALFETFRNSPPPLSTLAGHKSDVFAASFLPDGVHVLSVSGDQTIKEWDGRFGVATSSSETKPAEVGFAAIASDGKQILVGSETGGLTLWDQESKKPVRTWQAQGEKISCVTISPDSRLCASGAADGSVTCWDLENGHELRSFTGHRRGVLCLAFSPDGRRLLSGSVDWTAKLWEVSTGNLLQTFTNHGDAVFAAAFSPDGKYALTGSGDFFSLGRGTILAMWDVNTGAVYRSFMGHHAGISAVAFSPDGRRVLSGSWDGSVKLWDINVGRELQTFCGHQGRIWRLAFSANGRKALTSGADGLVRIWPTASVSDSRPLTGLSGTLQSVALSADGRLALAGCLHGINSAVMLWDAATGCELGGWKHTANVLSVALSPDGKLSLAGQEDGMIVLRDLASGRILQSLAGQTNAVNSVTFAADSARCLSGGEDGSVRLWELSKGTELSAFALAFPIRVVRFSPDNQFVAAAGGGPDLAIWLPASGKKPSSWQTGQGEIKDVAWSADGRRLISASYDKTVKVWEVGTQRQVSAIPLFDPLFSVAFGQQDQFAFSAHYFGGINFWEVASGRVLRTVQAYGSSVMSLAISADRLSLLSGGNGHEVNLWDFSRVPAYASFETNLAAGQSVGAERLALFGEWYAFRGFPEWGADLLERARTAGATISPLALARCHWLMNDPESARREFQRALDQKEAPEFYLKLCLSALDSKRVLGYRVDSDEVVFEFEPAAFSVQISPDDQVRVAGDFNQWLEAGAGVINKPLSDWQMERVAPNRYELRKKLSDFKERQQWEFKFVINLNQWIDPPGTALNRSTGGEPVNFTLTIPERSAEILN